MKSNVIGFIGFTCVGKSTIVEHLRKQVKHESIVASISYIDTDREVCKRLNKKHIFQVYEEYVNGRDRQDALKKIEEAENDFLENFHSKTEYSIIAFSPMIPGRKNWGRFIESQNPINIFLKVDAETAYRRLFHRRTEQIQDLCNYKNLGSWDQGMLTCYDDLNKQHIDLSKDESLKKISELIEQNESSYYNRFEKSFRSDEMRECRKYVLSLIRK